MLLPVHKHARQQVPPHHSSSSARLNSSSPITPDDTLCTLFSPITCLRASRQLGRLAPVLVDMRTLSGVHQKGSWGYWGGGGRTGGSPGAGLPCGFFLF